MIVWTYKIKGDSGDIITKNFKYAEEKSKLGCLVFCKGENNIFKYRH